MKFEIITITPEMAAEWLAAINGQAFRREDPVRTERYATDMQNDRWLLNGEPIINRGREDGFHRLSACVKSKTAFTTVHVYDVDPGQCQMIDTGKSRTTAQWLEHYGYENCVCLAALLSGIQLYQAGEWHWKGRHVRSPMELIMFLKSDEKRILDALSIAQSSKDIITSTITGTIAYVGTKTNFAVPSDSDTAKYFFDKLAHGENLDEDNAIHRLRERIFKEKTRNLQMYPPEKRALTILAWNKTCKGQTTKSLVWKSAGPHEQPFPTIEQAPEN